MVGVIMGKLIVIDGNSIMNRAFYALPPLTSSDGKPTNAVFGFCNILFKIISEASPTNMVVAFDVGKPTFRHLMYDGYKATRHKMPEDLAEQMPMIKDVLKTLGIKVLQKEGIEADDIIGTISKRFECPTIIVTGDRDCLQLVDNSTCVWLTKKGISEIDMLNNENFKEKMGIVPSQIIDLKAMMGDSSDNIPGIPGIGEKSAYEFLGQYQTVEGLYENVDKLTGAKEKKVREGKDLAFLSKTLATIKTDCDIDCDFEQTKFSLPFSAQAVELFRKLQFTSLLKKETFFNNESKNDLKIEKNNAKTLVLNSEKEINDILQKNNSGIFSIIFDGEKIQFAFDENINYSCDMKNASLFERILVNSKIQKIFYNAKLIHRQLFSNIDKFENFFDVLIASHIVEGSEIKENKKIAQNLEKYGAGDNYAVALINAKEILSKKLAEMGLDKLYYDVELPLSNVLYEMEKSGIKVDTKILVELSNSYKTMLAEIEQKIFILAGEKFNINSPKQLAVVLFDKLEIPTYNNSKRSTSVDVLESLENKHPIISLIMRYRKLTKLVSTYLDGFMKFVSQDGLVHTEFEQTITATGRLSSTNPNLQNIPIKDEDGKLLRKMFVPKNESNVFISADYNQIELRLLAHFSKDPMLVDAFNKNLDIHTSTASEIFDVAFDSVTPEMRRSAKSVNFGIIYGISDYGLSQNLKIPPKSAKEYIEKYFKTYPKVKEYMTNTIEKAKKNGYVCTLLGRKRYIPEIQSSNKNIMKFGERIAMNTPLQGTGSEIIKLAMNSMFQKMNELKLKAKLILQIHDELIIECPMGECEIVKKLLVDTMQNIVKLDVPLPVELGIGKSWYEI